MARIATWVAQEGLAVGRIVTEVGSALNGKRRKLLALRRDPTVTTIVVEPRDRLARFGAEEVEAALAAQGRRLLVVDPSEVDDDLRPHAGAPHREASRWGPQAGFVGTPIGLGR